MDYSFRVAATSDAKACAQIMRDWGDETPWMIPFDTLENLTEFRSDMFRDHSGWVAESEQRIVGFCARNDDNISALYVAPEARNVGVGKALLDLAKEGRDWITVWAYEDNVNARRFYQREGLVEIKRELTEYSDGFSLMDVEHRWLRAGARPVELG